MSEQKYEFIVTATAKKAGGDKMMDATITYYNMEYGDLVKAEKAAISGLLALGDEEAKEREGNA